MRIALAPRGESETTVTLGAAVRFPAGRVQFGYATRTGALLRIDGETAGAFDARHPVLTLPAQPGERDLELIVERRSLPTDGLPAGDGLRWRWYLARAAQTPAAWIEIDPAPAGAPGDLRPGVPCVGHAHLDVAWLWTYADARRKARRTFATALRQCDADPRYRFAQSQPQLYAWVRDDDPALFAQIAARAGAADGWDASIASMWVEPDLHAPSGESILRQFALGSRWTEEHLGVRPSVAWLPDTFGFPSTFPTLAVHAGIPYFATTKLQWNDTNRWPYPRFVWYGEDGSRVLASVIDAYEGDLDAKRIATALARGGELLVVGYGDGGGGATDAQLARIAPDDDPWRSVEASFAEAGADAALPSHRGELYLETHRGTYTTRRLVKARNAALERTLAAAEEAASWCVAVRAPKSVAGSLREDLETAWKIVLRAQFHDVLAGTSIAAVYDDVAAEYDRADAIAARVLAAATSVLPRADIAAADAPVCAPEPDGDGWIFANDYVRARVRADGTVEELAASGGPNLVTVANGLALYRDRPKQWDAWNLDRSYARRPLRVRPAGAAVDDGALAVRFDIGKRSRAEMRVTLREGEPWLRVELAVDWCEDHAILRVEHRFAMRTDSVRCGQPHGTLVRPLGGEAAPARFEVPAQRFVHASDGGDGVAIFARDLYGWNAAALAKGGVLVGTSLLRSPRWPDPACDRGEHVLAWALVPTAGAAVSGLEQAWRAYAEAPRVRLFTAEAENVLVEATYPAREDGAVIVRVRECDGLRTRLALRCGGRMREIVEVDAVERPAFRGPVAIEEEAIVADLGPFALRSFLVRF